MAMQQRRQINEQESHLRALPSQEIYQATEIKKQFQTLPDFSPEQIEQLILTVPAQFRETAIRLVAQQFVHSMILHMLQFATIFYQHAEAEGIHVEERDETLQDVQMDLADILALSQRLHVDSVDSLFRLGIITTSIINLSHFDTAEEAQSTLYAIAGLYQGWLERAHFFKEEQSE